MDYEISVIVYGLGTDPEYRSHWAFMIHRVGYDFGDLLHVTLLDLETLRFIFEHRSGTKLKSRQAIGRCRLAKLTAAQRLLAIRIMMGEKPPNDGMKRCQEWILEVLISLEVEELVPPGMSSRWEKNIGKPAKQVSLAMADVWEPLNK